MREDIPCALIAQAHGNIQLHKTNIKVYLSNPAGIGEHSDILEAIQGELDKISIHRDRIEILEEIDDDQYNTVSGNNPSIHEDPDLDPKEMLGVLREEVTMTEAMVIGWTDEGNLFMATSHGKAADMRVSLELPNQFY